MATTFSITCPECEKSLKVTDEHVGKKVRCKSCNAVFPVKAKAGNPGASTVSKANPPAKTPPKPAAKPASKPISEDDNDNKPYGVTEEYLGRRCPDCANAMEEEDRICLQCGYDTMTRAKARTRKVVHYSGFDIFLWLLPGIICAILVTALLVACTLMWIYIDRKFFGEEAWYDFLGSLGMKVYVSLISGFICYKAGFFAIRRLCINYRPPEIEIKMEKDKD